VSPQDAGGSAPEPGAIFDQPLFDPNSVQPPKGLDPTKDPAMQAAAPGQDTGASLADAKDQISGLPQGQASGIAQG
jgi:hypothetical protein